MTQLGDIVHHEVSEDEAEQINVGRVATPNPDADNEAKMDYSHPAIEPGDTVVLLVTRVNDDGTVNGNLYSDGVNGSVSVVGVDAEGDDEAPENDADDEAPDEAE